MTPCCSKTNIGMKRKLWTPEEDEILSSFVTREGKGRWRTLPKRAGLMRCGKSCRLRWLNYLRPSIKHGQIRPDEEDLIIRLHKLIGNRWSLIAGRIPGRTDNEIKNYWNTHLRKKLISQGIDPRTQRPLNSNNPNPNPILNPNPHSNPVSSSIDDQDASRSETNILHNSHDGNYIQGITINFDGEEGIDCCGDDGFSSFLDSLINIDDYVPLN